LDFSLTPSYLTPITSLPPMYVEPVSIRREAVIVSRRWWGARYDGGEIRPDHGDRVVDEEVVAFDCERNAGDM
jgi:hypothetical protein